MNTDQLRYFQTVAHVAHMSKAAEKLNISQPALSSNIRKLEFEVGVPLFDRAGRNIALNAYGQEFLECVERVMNDIDMSVESIQSKRVLESRTITIRMPNLSNYYGLFHRIYEKHPNINLNNPDCLFTDVEEKLVSGELDFCILGKAPDSNELTVKKVAVTDMVALVSDSGPYACIKQAPLSTFENDQFCDYPSKYASGVSPLIEKCHEAGFDVKIGFTGNMLLDLIDSVRYRDTIAWLPRYILSKHNLEGTHVVSLDPPANKSELYMVYCEKTLSKQPVANDVRQIVEDYFLEFFTDERQGCDERSFV